MWRISIGFIASVPFLPRISPELRWGSCDTQYRRSSGMPIHCFRSTTYRLLTAPIYAWIPDLDKIHVLTLSSCQEHGEYVRDSGLDINDPKLYGSINSRIEGNDDDGDTPQKLGSGPCYMDCTTRVSLLNLLMAQYCLQSTSDIKQLTELVRLSIMLASQYWGPSSLVILNESGMSGVHQALIWALLHPADLCLLLHG